MLDESTVRKIKDHHLMNNEFGLIKKKHCSYGINVPKITHADGAEIKAAYDISIMWLKCDVVPSKTRKP